MKKYLQQFLKDFDYQESDAKFLLDEYTKIEENKESNDIFCEIINDYEKTIKKDYYNEVVLKAGEAGKIVGVHPYTSGLLIFMCLSKHLKQIYKEKGISDEIYHNSMLDLKYKLIECKLVKKIVGSFVAWWFPGFFELTRFALGRLQFEICDFAVDSYEKDGKRLKKGDKVINVHIPRSETPIDKASCDDSYNQAKEFFKNEINDTPMAFVCHSWLLYPKTLEIFPKNSNTYRFAHEYDVIWATHDKEGDHCDAWRLFDMDYTGNVNDYPEDTSLRRVYKEYLKNGGTTGEGYGVLFA